MKKLMAAILACSMVASVGASTLISAADRIEKDSKISASALLRDDDTLGFTGTGDIKPASTYYVAIKDILAEIPGGSAITDAAGTTSLTGDILQDKDAFKVSLKKGSDNSKIIKKLSVVEKKEIGRTNAIKIETADVFTGDEYKITPEFKFVGQDATKKPEGHNWKGITIETSMTLYVQNEEVTGDYDIEAGTNGFVIKPAKNEDNEITWTQDGDNVARLTFYADSDVVKVFPKLSTKWDNSDYFEYFNDQDAFMFEFIGNNTVSSTSRALLEIYNPYVDEDGNLTVDPESIWVYEVKDGELVDVTDSWTKTTNEDGDEVLTTKTRVLGTYILAEEEVSIGDFDEPSTGEPSVPGNNKPNPSTGR